MKLKTNDVVKIISGKDKGKTGKITKIFQSDNKVIVAGVNKYKKHLKRKDANTPGSVVELERPIQVSNVMLFINNQTSRIGYTVTSNGDKIRIAKKTKEPVDKK